MIRYAKGLQNQSRQVRNRKRRLCPAVNSKSLLEYIYIYIYIYKSKVGDSSRGRPEGSLFSNYYTEV